MCDYSLHCVSNRPAKLGDQLVTSGFRDSLSVGFRAVGEPEIAVCLPPGAELAFAAEVELKADLLRTIMSALFGMFGRNLDYKVGRFRQINLWNPTTHHDAIEFPDGQVVLVTNLRSGQRATILQLPAGAPRLVQQPGHKALSAAPIEAGLGTQDGRPIELVGWATPAPTGHSVSVG